MTNVIRLPDRPGAPLRYKQGDIGRALLKGLRHKTSAADIEQVLFDLLFLKDDTSKDAAREVLADLLHSMERKA